MPVNPTICPNRPLPQLRLACAVVYTVILALLLLLVVQLPALATPSEEDFPSTSDPNTQNLADPNAVSPDQAEHSPVRPERPVAESSHDASNQGDETESARPTPRNFFPYTIRSGDTPQSIANIFGIETTELTRVNHITDDTGLIVGHTLRIPNPYLARMRELEGQIDRLSAERAEIDHRANSAQGQLDAAKAQVHDLSASTRELTREVITLPWWRAATYMAAAAAVFMFGMMLVALIEWLNLRGRFRAVAEMNEALRRLDYRYRTTVAKAELRLQELYGRRRRGLEDGQGRPRIPEDAELERLHQQLKEILESHLARLGPPGERARRARWRELIGGIGAPAEAEARTLRR
ncbi:MAG TPA: LysM peptidoglycan-binding domain-containing protein [Candidatus Binataceae bacterium]|nr:LysM peptidoglycan-binding domain-containing protein [Candidatus Binataceae bacterium]